jgi:glycerophosphoryl diester phosphodiesterase
LRDLHPIPTLSEVLELIGDRLTVYCELKGTGVVEVAAPILAKHRGPTAMHSFDHLAVRRAAELAPHVPRGILLVSRLVDTLHAMKCAHATTLWPQREYVDQALIEQVHEYGGRVIAWTVNDPAEIVHFSGMDIDGVCGDDVTAARAARQPTFPPPPA